jgi:hypothetical protein
MATSVFDPKQMFRTLVRRCLARAEQLSCWAGSRVWNWGGVSKCTLGRWTVATWESPVELPVDWDERKRVASPWERGEGGGSITTHIIGGGWDDSGGSSLACVARDASNERVLACKGVLDSGCAARL